MGFLNTFNVISEWDIAVLDWIASVFRCEFLDNFLPIFTHIADATVWIILCLILLCIPKTRKAGCYMAVALLLGVLVCNVILKPLVARIRPWDYIATVHRDRFGVRLLVAKLSDYSFPSGHAIASAEGSVALLFWKKRIGIPAVIVGTVVSFSRLYLFVHYPTDVIAGLILGTINAIIAHYLVDRYYDRVEAFVTQKWHAWRSKRQGRKE